MAAFKKICSVGWKFLFVRTICIRFIIYCVFITPQLDYLKMMMKGIWHGLRGRLGEFGTNRNNKIGDLNFLAVMLVSLALDKRFLTRLT